MNLNEFLEMDNNSHLITEGLVFGKKSKKLKSFIKDLKKKASRKKTPQLTQFITSLEGLQEEFDNLEKAYNYSKVPEERKGIKKYEKALVKQNKLIMRKLKTRTFLKGLKKVGILAAVIGFAGLMYELIDKNLIAELQSSNADLENITKIIGEENERLANIPKSKWYTFLSPKTWVIESNRSKLEAGISELKGERIDIVKDMTAKAKNPIVAGTAGAIIAGTALSKIANRSKKKSVKKLVK